MEDTGIKYHFMYVAECADGTLYTGYATDVQARIDVHNSGKGAKYTRSRLPVRLLSFAKFETKHEALSAEFHFKGLDRASKLKLINSGTSLEDAIRSTFF